MEKKPPRPMTPFDELTIPAELQTLKLLLPYTPVSEQQSIWIFIKFMELQHTIEFFQQQQNTLHSQTFRHFPISAADMLEEIAPYLPPETASMLDTFRNVMNIMEMMQMFQEYTDVSENPTENHSADADAEPQNPPPAFGGMNPMDLIMGMLSPEQQEMFQTYQSMFSNPESQNPTVPDTEILNTDDTDLS